ncbi:MAG: alpha/beta fold hydrolase [Thermomicrobiales bacterium]
MLRERQFTAGAVTLHYAETAEDGPPLVLLHGLSARWQTWLAVMPTLTLRWRLYAPDLRGFGRSSRAPGAYRALDYATDIAAFLREIVGRPAALVAHSLGAVVALVVAADAPELVRALVLEEPPLGIFTDESMRERREYEAYRRQRDLALRNPSLEEAAAVLGQALPTLNAVEQRFRAAALLQRDPETVTFVLEDRAKEGLDLERRLPRITCPALLVQGDATLGSALDDAHADRALALLPHATRIKVSTAGHFIHDAAPLDFARLAADFLETV